MTVRELFGLFPESTILRVLSGYNDRGYNKGDIVRFIVMDSQRIIPGYVPAHPLHGATYRITYVLSGWGIKDDYVVFGIRPIESEGKA